MSNLKSKSMRASVLGLFTAVTIVLQLLSYVIKIGTFNLSLVLIPIVLAAVLYGPKYGAVLGGVFGLCSVWANTTTPGLLSFAFSPFMTTEGLPGVFKALWIALGCRILFGIVAGWLWKLLKKTKARDWLALPLTAAVATILHTVLVMGSIYLLLAQQYAAAKNVALSAVFGLVMGTVTASGIPEAIAAALLVTMIGKALLKLVKKS